MLQEKVANVAHGWLLKEEFAASEGAKAAEKSQLKHYWFVLFSNGILMYFDSPMRAMLGEARGFMPVAECAFVDVWVRTGEPHVLSVRCASAACAPWLLAGEDHRTTSQWGGVLRDAARFAGTRTPAVGGSAVEICHVGAPATKAARAAQREAQRPYADSGGGAPRSAPRTLLFTPAGQRPVSRACVVM